MHLPYNNTSYSLCAYLYALDVVLFTKWTLATQTVDRSIRKTHGTKLAHHF